MVKIFIADMSKRAARGTWKAQSREKQKQTERFQGQRSGRLGKNNGDRETARDREQSIVGVFIHGIVISCESKL